VVSRLLAIAALPAGCVMIRHALRYAQLGIPVFPVWSVVRRNGRIACACGRPCGEDNIGKHPIGHLVPNGALDATTDPKTIKRWWSLWPDANIGIRLTGLVVIDDDPRNGGDHTLVDLRISTDHCRERGE
jgi:hypothetical protein